MIPDLSLKPHHCSLTLRLTLSSGFSLSSPTMETQLVEITLISAQGLKIPPHLHRIQTYAVTWVDPAHKLRTRIDRTSGPDPTWNDRFVFRLPTSFLLPDSSSAICIEIYCTSGWYNNDSLVGSVRFLIGGERLLSRAPNSPSFAALGNAHT
jgi:C2 domain